MIDPIFWLGLSILLVAISLTAVLVAALPAFQELARAARSAQKLFDTLSRELPPTLESIRLTGLEISDLTDEMNQGVQSAGRVVQQVDESIDGVKQQAQKVQVTTKSVVAGLKAGWKTFTRKPNNSANGRRGPERLPPAQRMPVDLRNRPASRPSDNELPAETLRDRASESSYENNYLPEPESVPRDRHDEP